MSSISATGLSLGIFQSVAGEAAAQSNQTSTAANPVNSDPTASPQQTTGATHHHHHAGGMFGKIEQAVTNALQSAQSNSSADPNQIIQDAITKALQGGSGGNGPSSGAPSAGAADPDGDGGTSPPAQTTAASSNQSFFQMLQSFGVDPQQFHNDFLAAVQSAQGGTVDPSMAFQSFPPGSSINTTG